MKLKILKRYNIKRNIFILYNIKNWVKRNILNIDKFSASEYEKRYWQKTGLKEGPDFYSKYLDKFKLTLNEMNNLSVGDFGSGPFGGILLMINNAKEYFPIDILADDFNKWGMACHRIYRFDGKTAREIDSNSIDIMFCCNVIDHTRYPKYIIKEIYRLLKPNGVMYIHVHLRNKNEINKGHPVGWDENFFRKVISHYFKIEWSFVEDRDYVNNNQLKTLYAKLIK